MSAAETAPLDLPEDLRNGEAAAEEVDEDEAVDELDALPGEAELPEAFEEVEAPAEATFDDELDDDVVVPAPVPVRPLAKRRKAPKPEKVRARTSRVVVRRVDPWSVLKLSLIFYLCVCLVLLVAGCLLWAGASAAGVVENIEGFVSDIGFDDFKFVPADILRASTIGGLVLVVAGTLANTLLAVLFNLMGDVVGGLKVTLAEDLRKPRRRG
jgi:hypothetical protein